MVPKEAVERIDNLLISTTENGVQDHKSLLATYKFLNKILEKKQIKKPVVLLSDGHSSRLDFEVLTYLHEQQIYLFISPPDTTGATQLLDQINHALHDNYRQQKKEQYLSHHTINREGFVNILSNIWSTWASKDSIVNAAKRVGITSNGLNVEWMQQNKFERAEKLLRKDEPTASSTPNSSLIMSPKCVRSGSKEYYKQKYEQAMKVLNDLSDESINLEVAGVLKVEKIKPKEIKKPVRITQICGSLEGKNALELLRGIQKDKEDLEEKKKNRLQKKESEKQAFLKCKDGCSCKTKKCAAAGLKQCPHCLDVLHSICSKSICRKESGAKPDTITIKSIGKANPRKKLLDDYLTDRTDNESNLDDSDSESESDESDMETEEVENLHMGDYVKIVSGLFKGYYATVLGESYGEEKEIQYFEEKFGKWILKDGDIDSRPPEEMMKVTAVVDGRSRYTFSA